METMQRVRVIAECERCGEELFRFLFKFHWDQPIKCMHCGAVHAPLSTLMESSAPVKIYVTKETMAELDVEYGYVPDEDEAKRPPNEMEHKPKCAKCGLLIPTDDARVVDPVAGTQRHFLCPDPARG